ncbi:hypothetical protein ACJX0J_013413, partial [Zea mays]
IYSEYYYPLCHKKIYYKTYLYLINAIYSQSKVKREDKDKYRQFFSGVLVFVNILLNRNIECILATIGDAGTKKCDIATPLPTPVVERATLTRVQDMIQKKVQQPEPILD